MTETPTSRRLAQRHLVLLGPMGAGKSTLGHILAQRLGRPFVDSDRELERDHEATASQLANDRGVAHLHALEAEHLQGALGGGRPAVIAAAASTGDLPQLESLVRDADAFIVLLTGDADEMLRRAEREAHRRKMPIAEHRRLTRRRHERVKDLADLIIDTTVTKTPEQMAEMILAHLGPSV